jgi:hypothetical protein
MKSCVEEQPCLKELVIYWAESNESVVDVRAVVLFIVM